MGILNDIICLCHKDAFVVLLSSPQHCHKTLLTRHLHRTASDGVPPNPSQLINLGESDNVIFFFTDFHT
jgi:hypothetical protein